MFNEQETATKSYQIFEDELKEAGNLSDEEWVFDLSYNHDERLFSIFQVFRQRQSESASTFWTWISGLWLAPDWFQSLAFDLEAHGDLAQAVRDSDLRRHIENYKKALMEGNRVLVVGHSQGSLYANSAHTNLVRDENDLPMDAFGIVAVGTPSGRVAGGGSHITLTDDLVINAVRALYSGTLEGNVLNTNPSSDWKNHNFIGAYLNGDQSGPMVINSVLAAAHSLAWPEPELGSGPITVTLTWGGEPDVDLHVFEPDGSHVYYMNKQGTSGYLDYDDVSAWGPEHYYVVDCESLATGSYQVGLNYYRGTDPETAYVQIQAGDVLRNYLVSLPEVEGSAGNSNPEPVADIEVAEDPDHPETGYTFTVVQKF